MLKRQKTGRPYASKILFILIVVSNLCLANFRVDANNTQAHAAYPNPMSHTTPAAQSLWTAVRQTMVLPHEMKHPAVQQQIAWFMNHKHFLYASANNAKPYMAYIYEQIKKRHLPTELVLLPMIESGYNPFAYSSAGAAGLWQMMPGTASGFGLKQNWWYDGRRDVIASTNAALDYLAYLQKFFNGNWILAIAAYDTGEGAVLSAIRKNIALGKNTDFWSLPLAKETQAYIPKLLALAEMIDHPQRYALDLPAIDNKPYLAKVTLNSQIDLKKAARMSGISLKQLLKLNPGYNRWATNPEGPSTLVVPIENLARFKANLARLPESERVTWQRHTVTHGDTLGKIARQHHTSVTLLKNVNKLTSDTIHQGDVLFIPLSTENLPSTLIKSAQHYLHTKDEQHAGPQQIRHLVQKGDTIWSIAKKYHTRVSAIRFWNSLSPNKSLQPNQTIIIWTKNKALTAPAAPMLEKIHYTVRRGDSLSRLAVRFNTSEDAIQQDNHLHSDQLLLGQTLHILENENDYPAQRYIKKVHYTVKEGDSLSSIAFHFYTNISQIKELNHLTNNAIHAGQKLTIIPRALPSLRKNNPKHHPMLYFIQAHDTLSEITKKLHVSLEQLFSWNPKLKDNDFLRVGDVLLVKK